MTKTVQTKAHGSSDSANDVRLAKEQRRILAWVSAAFLLFVLSVGITQLQLNSANERQKRGDALDLAQTIYLANLRAYTAEVGSYSNCVTIADGTNTVRMLFLFLANAPELSGSNLITDFKTYMDTVAPEKDVDDCVAPVPPVPPASLVDAGVVNPTTPPTEG